MLKVNRFSNHILRNINFSLEDGENLIILGSNGAGKSTLAKVLCGLTPSEDVEIFSKKLSRLSAKQRAKLINYVPTKLDIFDEYISMREYLELSRLYSEFNVDQALKLLALEDLQEKSCKNLSSGEGQLTMLCSALLHNAKITIFDEPTANLDPKKTKQVFHFLQNDHIQQKIIITHDLNIAHKLGFKILYMEDGTVTFFGKNGDFFEEGNLQNIFGSSLKTVAGYFMVNL
ncbi:MAG: ABC transporter ATP-binding protein [Campylobacterales bacterium]|nr:ABC transporter ATP-binding protein [Campylobacterales bacterium]